MQEGKASCGHANMPPCVKLKVAQQRIAHERLDTPECPTNYSKRKGVLNEGLQAWMKRGGARFTINLNHNNDARGNDPYEREVKYPCLFRKYVHCSVYETCVDSEKGSQFSFVRFRCTAMRRTHQIEVEGAYNYHGSFVGGLSFAQQRGMKEC